MANPVRVRGFFCALPCAETTLRPGATAASFHLEGGCPACREEIAWLLDGEGPAARVDRREAGLAEAVEAAGLILLEARSPFIYGLSRSSNRTARLAVALAASLRGALDLEGADRQAPDLLCLQTFGLPGATLGEIGARADLLILWRCDPRRTHPHLFARGPGTPLGRTGARTVVLVPPGNAAEPAQADLVLPVAAGGDLEVALALRALAAGRALAVEAIGGVALAAVRRAAELCAEARYVAILWDHPAAAPGGAALAAALTLLARDLAGARRCAAMPLTGTANLAGAMEAVAGATGLPRAVGFASGRPRFAPGEHDAGRMIGGAAADALLLIGARSIAASRDGRPRSGPGGAGSGPPPRTIVIGPRHPEGAGEPDVMIRTAVPGLSAAGSARRADGVPIVLRAVLGSPLPTEESVLEALAARIAARRGALPREAAR